MATLGTAPWVHAAVARRLDPDLFVCCGTTPADVPGLEVTLLPTPGATRVYALRVEARLLVLGDRGQHVLFSPFLQRAGRRALAPWRPVVPPGDGMLAVSHDFTGVPGDGQPVSCGLAIKTDGGEARYSVGYLLAIAERESPLTVHPKLGPLVRLPLIENL